MSQQPRRPLVMLVAAMALAATHTASRATDPPPSAPPVVVLAEVGLTPEGLAAAGFSVSEAAAIAAQLEPQRAAIEALETQKRAAAQLGESVHAAHEALAAAPGNDEACAALATLRSQHAEALSQAQDAEAAILGAVLDGLPTVKVDRLLAFMAGSRFRVDLPLRVAPQPEGGWPQVEVALRAEERSLRTGVPLDTESHQLLGELRARTEVVEAEQGLLLQLDAIRQALGGQP